MKKLVLSLAFFLTFVLLNANASYSQINDTTKSFKLRTPFSIGLVIGMNSPLADRGGAVEDFYLGKKYAQKTGASIGVQFRIPLRDFAINIGDVFDFGSGKEGTIGNSYPNSKIKIDIMTMNLNVGGEYYFANPFSKIRPYVSLSGLLNFFFMNAELTNIPGLKTGTLSPTAETMPVRVGIGFGAGVTYRISKVLGGEINLRYDFQNLIGKKYDDYDKKFPETIWANLNDDKDPDYLNNPYQQIKESRSLSAIRLNFVLNFYLLGKEYRND